MAKLSTKKRKRLKTSSFALKKDRAYPINDLDHGRAALRELNHATPSEQTTIKAAVYRKFPSLRPDKGKKNRTEGRMPPGPITLPGQPVAADAASVAARIFSLSGTW